MSKRKHFHFIGIAGTAMGSTAAALQAQGHTITGSDNSVYPPMSTLLESQGIQTMIGYKPENLPTTADVIVVGNAISRGNAEVEAVLEHKRVFDSMAGLLKRHVIQGKRSFVVTGTHGKTTTTSMLAWLFESAGLNPGFMIGGVPDNFTVGARFNDSSHFVIEGDEYDTAFFDKRSKFLHYLPECAIVNNVEFDHADIFRDLDEIILAFQRMTLQVPRNGLVLINGDCANSLTVKEKCPAPSKTVGTGESCDVRIVITDARADSTDFTLNGVAFTVPMIGEFNVRNAAMAICAARFGGLADDQIRSGLLAFRGVKRRQTERGEKNGITIIDDFGHHPTAIRVTLQGLRQRYPGRRLWALFEPRSNTSRRKVLQNDLVEALKTADGSVLAAINAIEKVPVELRLDPEQVTREVNAAGRECYYEPGTDAIIDRLKSCTRSGDVIVVFSNGGFDGMHEKLLARL
ncbi:MAG: UDP-N-acetylmuramate:L-alanyl-gamma-D-glutamyl-meso-diaminopimelate ligase [Verrucomicrobiaceae bacterium]|nr:UDP-N-acetylmuramate:L-alanyl-gamma-D-glutamyl-meso-diaminopimelate ligase [Verrucomicrobiaceae bacterium]